MWWIVVHIVALLMTAASQTPFTVPFLCIQSCCFAGTAYIEGKMQERKVWRQHMENAMNNTVIMRDWFKEKSEDA